MAIRQIIEIDEAACTGCGECATGCPEGALRIIDGKARMVGENLCDGLGACIGTCPEGAITIVEREAEAYEEAKVMEGMVKLGPKVMVAHLEHLAHHGQDPYVREALAWLKEKGIPLPAEAEPIVASIGRAAHGPSHAATPAHPSPARPAAALSTLARDLPHFEACPGSAARTFTPVGASAKEASAKEAGAKEAGAKAVPATAHASSPSALSSWPIQLHLINPRAPQFADADILIAADCTAFSLGGFHAALLEGKSLTIACPKLDQGREIYVDKLTSLIGNARSVTVAIMEVPCCSGLLKLVLDAREAGTRKPRIKAVTLGIQGGIISEEIR